MTNKLGLFKTLNNYLFNFGNLKAPLFSKLGYIPRLLGMAYKTSFLEAHSIHMPFLARLFNIEATSF